jgi:hypothetical protein
LTAILATSPLATWLILGLVFGSTAALFWFGIRAPIQPPDPDWREHQPASVKAPRSYWIAWWIGTGFLFSMALIASVTDQKWIGLLAFGGWAVASVFRHVFAFRHSRSTRQPR